jgi:O-antigen/teichoic acid export membrane protein
MPVTVRNIGWNLIGFGLPLIVAVVCIPPLVQELGTARFGLLTLIWAVVSYFGVFDLGLGRALTQQVSAAIGSGRESDVPSIAATGLAVMLLLGVIAGVLMWALAPAGIASMTLPNPAEAEAAARAMAWSLPFIVLTSGLRGILESRGTFRAINLIRIATGALTYVLPIAIVRAGMNDLAAIAWALGAMRAASCAWHALLVAREVPGALSPKQFDRLALSGLLRFGGWLTVSNVVSPLMGYLDRFVVAALLSLEATAWYVTPKEMVTKLLIVPTAIGNVLFPRLSSLGSSKEGQQEAVRLEDLSLSAVFLLLFPVTLALALCAPLVLRMWVGEEFARAGSTAMAVVCLGVLLNGLATIPFLSIQARGRSDLTALANVFELPLFIGAVYLMTREWGVTGAAMAWTLRVAIDLVALQWMSARLRSDAVTRSDCRVALVVAALAGVAFALAFLEPTSLRALGSIGAGTASMALIAYTHRDTLRTMLRARSV